MSIRIMSLIWERAPHQGGAILTLLALADWANDDGECWPSLPKLALKARQSERNVRYILQALQEEDLVRIVPGPGLHHTNHYHLNLDKLQTLQPLPGLAQSLQPLQGSEHVTLQNATANPANGDVKPCKLQPASSDPSGDPSGDPSPSPTPPPAGEGQDPDDAVAGGEESADALQTTPTPPAADESAQAAPPVPATSPPAKEAPWGKTMTPEAAACRLCDWRELVEVWQADGTPVLCRCPHDVAALAQRCQAHGFTRAPPDADPAAPPGGHA